MGYHVGQNSIKPYCASITPLCCRSKIVLQVLGNVVAEAIAASNHMHRGSSDPGSTMPLWRMHAQPHLPSPLQIFGLSVISPLSYKHYALCGQPIQRVYTPNSLPKPLRPPVSDCDHPIATSVGQHHSTRQTSKGRPPSPIQRV